MLKKIFFILIHCSLFSLWAQELPIGQFKEYLSYNKFHSVAQDKENIYAATTQSLLVVDKLKGSLHKWSKLNGLSETGVQTIYADPKNRLIVAYTNSNIDIIIDYKVHNIRDILNKQLTGSKAINSIFCSEDFAYFSCDFGVVILDLKTFLVKDSWFTIRQNEAYQVLCFAIHNGRYYLGTNNGVFSLPVTASNPADFSMWTQESLVKSSFKFLCSYQDKLFAVRDGGSSQDSLFTYTNSNWKYDNSLRFTYFRSFEVKNDQLLVCSQNAVKVFMGNEYKQYTWEPTPPRIYLNGRGAIFDDRMNIWVADNSSGLMHINTEDQSSEVVIAEGPANAYAYGLCFTEGMLALVPGVRNGIIPNWNAATVSLLQDEHWWTYTSFYPPFDHATGFNSVVINPLNKRELYMGSANGGLFKIDTASGEVTCYDASNSPLISNHPLGAIFVFELAFDKQNNLWITHSQVSDFLKVKTKDNKWYSFNLHAAISTAAADAEIMAEHLLIDSRNYKWVTIPRQNTLVVFYENGSLDNTAVHKKAEINLTSQVEFAGSRITCIAEDRKGNIWTGADQGVKVVDDAASVFNGKPHYAKNILLEQNGYVQVLLATEYITCIAVDAADRKWIGTRNAGVFLISPTGTQELFHFTTDNSPIFSNQINDIKINPENGEVFIATEGGLISYKGTATAGKENYTEALVYPNPVREDYYGPVAVKGLMEDSFCKITDAAGNLVWQGYAYGGQLIWNGKDFYGNRPASGVYFVMASSKSGKEKKVAKFLFIQ